MRHRAFAAAMGLATAALFASGGPSQAASADPTGYWMKPDAERESKIQVFKCGKDKKLLCAKLAWLKNPLDSKGKPLTDVRNEDPSLRDRKIVGLTIFSGLTPTAPATWTGKIYNPEDGQTYTATLTVLSRSTILLKGCKAWLLCGERQWYRTSAPEEVEPAAPAEGARQIEASVTPPLPKPEAVAATTPARSVEPPASAEPTGHDAIAAAIEANSPPQPAAPEITATPVAFVTQANAATGAHAVSEGQPGYRFLSIDADKTAPALTGDNVTGLFAMANSAAGGGSALPVTTSAPAWSDSTAAVAAKEPVQAAQPKPKPVPKAIAASAAGTPKPAAKQTASAEPAAGTEPLPEEAEAEETGIQAAAADASLTDAGLTRRERRLLRRQQRQHEPFLPWLR